VTALGLGCAPLGNLYSQSPTTTHSNGRRRVGSRAALLRHRAVYGNGLSETRIGAALRARPRDEYVLASKVGRLLREPSESDHRRSSRACRRSSRCSTSLVTGSASIAESLRTTRDRSLDVVHVHDPDDHEQDALDGAFPALIELREQGVIGASAAG
jgi:D-threo-aldose 1-dehydrogenase